MTEYRAESKLVVINLALAKEATVIPEPLIPLMSLVAAVVAALMSKALFEESNPAVPMIKAPPLIVVAPV